MLYDQLGECTPGTVIQKNVNVEQGEHALSYLQHHQTSYSSLFVCVSVFVSMIQFFLETIDRIELKFYMNLCRDNAQLIEHFDTLKIHK